MTAYLIALLSILLGAVAQILLKMGVSGATRGEAFVYRAIPGLLTDLRFGAGIIVYAASLLLWLYVLSRLEVSRAYPMVSIGYIVTMVLAYIFVGESLTLYKIAGAIFIIAGVWLIAKY